MVQFFEPVSNGITQIRIILPRGGGIHFPAPIPYLATLILNRYGTKREGEKFYSRLEERAIQLSFNLQREYLQIKISALDGEIKKGLELLKELLTSPNLTEESLKKGVEELREIRKKKRENKDWVAGTLLFKAMFPDTPLQTPLIGEGGEVTLSQLQDYFKTGIARGGEVVLIVGKRVDVELDYLPLLSSPSYPHFVPKQGQLVEKMESEQAYIHFGAPYHHPFEESHLRKLAIQILGAGGFGSRLMEEIRVKRGWAYSAYCYTTITKFYSIFRGYLQTKLENQREAVRLLEKIVAHFVEKGVTEKELAQAKKFLIGSEPLRKETPLQRLERRFAEYWFGLGNNFFEEEMKKIESTTLEELNRYISSHSEILQLSYGIVSPNFS